jgi:hypothetical protein
VSNSTSAIGNDGKYGNDVNDANDANAMNDENRGDATTTIIIMVATPP